MKKLFYLVTLVSSVAYCQSDADVMVPINNLFKGMHDGDSALVHSAFEKTVTFVSVMKNKAGKTLLVPEPLNDFLVAVGTPHAEKWNEPVWDVTIRIDGVFAQVWAPYAFYVDKKFSHCGVDAFHLVKGDDGKWRIFHLADTRQREGCSVPEKVKKMYE